MKSVALLKQMLDTVICACKNNAKLINYAKVGLLRMSNTSELMSAMIVNYSSAVGQELNPLTLIAAKTGLTFLVIIYLHF